MNHHCERLVATVCGLAALAAGGLLTGCASDQSSATPATTSATTSSTISATAEPSAASLTYATQGTHAVGSQPRSTDSASVVGW